MNNNLINYHLFIINFMENNKKESIHTEKNNRKFFDNYMNNESEFDIF